MKFELAGMATVWLACMHACMHPTPNRPEKTPTTPTQTQVVVAQGYCTAFCQHQNDDDDDRRNEPRTHASFVFASQPKYTFLSFSRSLSRDLPNPSLRIGILPLLNILATRCRSSSSIRGSSLFCVYMHQSIVACHKPGKHKHFIPIFVVVIATFLQWCACFVKRVLDRQVSFLLGHHCGDASHTICIIDLGKRTSRVWSGTHTHRFGNQTVRWSSHSIRLILASSELFGWGPIQRFGRRNSNSFFLQYDYTCVKNFGKAKQEWTTRSLVPEMGERINGLPGILRLNKSV